MRVLPLVLVVLLSAVACTPEPAERSTPEDTPLPEVGRSGEPLTIGGRCTAPSLATGAAHSCLVRPGGTVACWGANGLLQVGVATPALVTAPTDVPGVLNAVAVTAGTSHTCALLGDGTVTCWGSNSSGQLGDGHVVRTSAPVAVAGLTGITSIAAGALHTCALRNDGTIWCWGSNGSGRLGDGTTTRRPSPVAVQGLSGAKAIVAGASHTCALTSAGLAYCWGANASGQLGDGTKRSHTRPVAVSGGSAWRSLAAAQSHTCGVLQAPGNGVRCWGKNTAGQLGDGSILTTQLSPVDVLEANGAPLTDGVSVTAGGQTTCLVRGNGAASCWGTNSSGQVGDGTTASPRRAPTGISATAPLAGAFNLVSSGLSHTCALAVSGEAYCWGANASGQLGDGTRTRRTTPTRVGTQSGLTFGTFASEDEVAGVNGAAASAILATGDELLAAGLEHTAGADRWVLRRSRDRGANWTTANTFTFQAGLSMQAPRLLRLAGGTLFLAGAASTDDGDVTWVVRRSADGGDTWSDVDAFVLGRGLPATLRGLTAGASLVYVAGSAEDASGRHALVRASANNGDAWFVLDDVTASGAEARALLDLGSSGVFVAGHANSGGTAHLRVRHAASVVPTDRATLFTDADDFQYEAGFDTFAEAIAADLGGRIYVLARANGTSGWRAVLRVSSDGGSTFETASTFQLEAGQDSQAYDLLVDRAGTLHLVGSAARSGGSARGLVASSYDHGATWVVSDELGAASALTSVAEDSTGALHAAGALGSGQAARWTVRSRSCLGISPSCGNWIIDPGELCDGDCSDCNDHDACTTDAMQGSAVTCNVACTNTPITSCVSGDGCCPAGCTSDRDLDCCTGPIDQGVCLDVSFKIESLAADGCTTLEHSQITGASRGGLAVSTSEVFYTGQGTANRGVTGRFSASDLTGGRATIYRWDHMFSDLRTGTAYVLGGGIYPVSSAAGNVTTLIPLNADTGATMSPRITLSRSIQISSARALFSGYGRLLLHNGARIYDIQLPSGQVTDLGSMVLPTHNTCANNGTWGLAESFGGALYVDYAAGDEIHRTRVPDGLTTTLQAFSNLGGTCAIGFSAARNRWYLHHAGTSQFASGTEILGSCDATFRRPNAPSSCGDGVLEATETCEGSCPASCDDGVACTADHQTGAPSTCDIACTHTPITLCANGDGCCVAGCNHNDDDDCAPVCGNGVVESGESCDGNCPASCDDGNACTTDLLTGSAGACNAACGHAPVVSCTNGDGCCPTGCNANTDDDCTPVCGNGVVEPGETCEGNCPTSCTDSDVCTTDTLTGSASSCNAACTHAPVTACLGGDGCCPSGCTGANDSDCGLDMTSVRSCLDLKNRDPSSTSGLYTFDPDGTGPLASVTVYCDMAAGGGAWTMVAAMATGMTSQAQISAAAVGTMPTSRTLPASNTYAKLSDAAINAIKNSNGGAGSEVGILEEGGTRTKYGRQDCVWRSDQTLAASDTACLQYRLNIGDPWTTGVTAESLSGCASTGLGLAGPRGCTTDGGNMLFYLPGCSSHTWSNRGMHQSWCNPEDTGGFLWVGGNYKPSWSDRLTTQLAHVDSGAAVSIALPATDPNGDAVTLQVTASTLPGASGSGGSLTAPAPADGLYQVTVVGADPYGNTTQARTVSIHVGSPLRSCLAWKNTFSSAASGLYTIDSDGVGGNAPFTAYCDMTSGGGAWTQVAALSTGMTSQAQITAAETTLKPSGRTLPASGSYVKFSDTVINQIKNSNGGGGAEIGIWMEGGSRTKYGRQDCVWKSDTNIVATDTACLQYRLNITDAWSTGVIGEALNGCPAPGLGLSGAAATCRADGGNMIFYLPACTGHTTANRGMHPSWCTDNVGGYLWVGGLYAPRWTDGLTAESQHVEHNASISLALSANDPNNDALTYRIVGTTTLVSASFSGSTLVAPAQADGTYTVQIQAVDAGGNTSPTRTITILVGTFPASCLALKNTTPSATSGTYTIDYDGPSGHALPISVYCDMSSGGGAWTMVSAFATGMTSQATISTGAVGTMPTTRTLPASATYVKLSDAIINQIKNSNGGAGDQVGLWMDGGTRAKYGRQDCVWKSDTNLVASDTACVQYRLNVADAWSTGITGESIGGCGAPGLGLTGGATCRADGGNLLYYLPACSGHTLPNRGMHPGWCSDNLGGYLWVGGLYAPAWTDGQVIQSAYVSTNAAISVPLYAVDPNGDAITYRIVGTPTLPSASISGSTLVAPGAANGTYTAVVQAVDANGNVTANRTVTVNVSATAPQLLLHGDGLTGGTTFTNAGSGSYTITRSGTPVTTTAQSRFGGGSLVFAGSPAELDLSASQDWNCTAVDCTLDFWIRPTAYTIYLGQSDAGNSGDWMTYAYSNGRVCIGVNGVNEICSGASALVLNTWSHLAFVKRSGVTTIYLNGTSVASASTMTWTNSASKPLRIGGCPFAGAGAYLDEIRFIKGMAAWTANFTPPTSPY